MSTLQIEKWEFWQQIKNISFISCVLLPLFALGLKKGRYLFKSSGKYQKNKVHLETNKEKLGKQWTLRQVRVLNEHQK